MSPEEENYRKLLRAHDWYYDYSDDHSVWKRGVAARDTLNGIRRAIDPEGTIWNELAPDMFKVKPIPQKPVSVLPPIKLKKPGGPGNGA
ncbi:MAG TPA: hypothetical protein VHP34_09415 [Alphaproteobacteria bacterium]|jgi:hypothetical protein|nr:hypothetical protein [Alphaproteobacteria bacterium]